MQDASGTTVSIWLTQDGEPLPLDSGARLMRTGILAEVLHSRGVRVDWFASRFDHTQKRQRSVASASAQIHPGYDIHLLSGPGYSGNVSLRRILHQRKIAQAFLSVAGKRDIPDLLIASYPSPELCAAAASFAEQHKVPLIVDVRDPWPDIFTDYLPMLLRGAVTPVTRHYRNALRYALKRSQGIFANSEALLSWALHHAGRERQQHDRVFYHACADPGVSPHVRESFSVDAPLRAIFVGSLGHSYDLFSIVEVAKILKSQNERRIRLEIMGDGELGAELKFRAQGLENLKMWGWLDATALRKELPNADVGLLLMKGKIAQYTVPNKMGEYLSYGLALINSLGGEPQQLVSSAQLGLNLSPEAPEALAEALVSLLSQGDKLRSYRENARALYVQKFSAAKVYEDYAQAALSLCGGIRC